MRSAPRFVSAGDRYETLFAVRNIGNTVAMLHLALAESDSFRVHLDSAIVHLEPGAERIVRAEVMSIHRATRTLSHRLGLTARFDRDTTHVEPAVSVVEVIPRHSVSAPRFRSLPSQLTLRRTEGAAHTAAITTFELRGGGVLSSARATKLEYLFRGPNQTASFSGDLDEYRLSFASPRVRLQLGDQVPSYSRLGESWRPGFGAAAQLLVGAVTAGAFGQRDRRSYGVARQDEQGASVDARLFGSSVAGVRYVARTGATAGDVWTAHALLSPFTAATFDGEYGHGRDLAGTGSAYAATLSGAFPRASYAVRRLASDAGFPGLTRGNTSSEALATLLPFARVRLSGSLTDWSGTRSRAFAPRISEWQRAMDGRVAWGELLEAGYRRSTEARLLPTTLRGRRTESLRLFIGAPLGIAFARGGIEQGVSVFDDAPGDRVPFRRLSALAGIARGENMLSASAEWQTGMPMTSWIQDEHVSVALNAGVRLARATHLAIALSVASYGGAHPRMPTVLDVGVTQNLPFGHRASWRTRALSYGPGFPPARATHQADYMVPFGLPIGLSGESGTVQAQLVDRDAGRPLAGTLVRLGGQARFTDAEGRVTFGGLAAGTHYLDVDRGLLAADRVVVPMVPFGVVVDLGETRRIEVGVIRGARLRGEVHRFTTRPSATFGAAAILDDSGSISGAVLQLSNGVDTLRASLDSWGKFSFSELTPGSWVLSVIFAELPRHYRFEQERFVVALQPGETQDLALRIVPAGPPVQIIAEAELTLDASTAVVSRALPVTAPFSQWVNGRRRIVPAPADSASMGRFRSATSRSQWENGVRRLVPTPPDTGLERVTLSVIRHWYTVTRWDIGLMHVARVMYDDPSLWPKIWLANLDQVPDPDVIRAGQRLRIPDHAPLTVEEESAHERWRRAGGAIGRP